ncbi:10322_t:CDS:2 [Dentiscutata erythropus]|uniref:10322_t:CDS:1 n=1 Tax=Dentiscutata erythropus TaxID=1348616 RepID=A0A9N9BCX2_9GLOM|nr:10322_t:CDS:2 [Dentiscutata erythropus]
MPRQKQQALSHQFDLQNWVLFEMYNKMCESSDIKENDISHEIITYSPSFESSIHFKKS